MTSFSRSRRRFLESLRLGVGASLLGPLVTRLHAEAWGQSMPPPRNVVFISMSDGLPDKQLGVDTRQNELDWTYHEALEPLSPWRSRTLILRNLSLGLSAMQHSGGYGLLAGIGAGDGETKLGNVPQGQTIDQFLADRTGEGLITKSILFGIDSDASKVMHQSLYAAGPNQPVSHPVQASKLYELMFPSAVASLEQQKADRRVLDRLRLDIGRARGKLAGAERARMDSYLETLEDFDRRRSSTQCLAPNAPGTERGAVKELPVMLDMAAVALRCGMTRVVGCSVGGGNSHFHFPRLVGPHVGTIFEAQGYVGEHGHDGAETYDASRTVSWKWLSGVVADFLRQLEAPGPTGRPVLDDTVVVLFSDGGHAHHNLENSNWRFVLIGNAGGALKADGRFLSFKWDVPWQPLNPDSRSVNSLWCTLAHAMGAPIDAFAPAGGARTNGPLSEVLA